MNAKDSFFCVGGEEAVRGFALAGVPGAAVRDRAGAEAALAGAAGSGCAVLIVTSLAAGLARATVDRMRLAQRPLVVEIEEPGTGAPAGGAAWK